MDWEDPWSDESAELDAEISMDTEFKQLFLYWKQLNDASLIKAPTKGLNERMNERMFSKHDSQKNNPSQFAQ